MADSSPREVITRFSDALNRGDWDAAVASVHPDYVDDFPQSGERIRGRDNLRGMFSNYPGASRRGALFPKARGSSEGRTAG